MKVFFIVGVVLAVIVSLKVFLPRQSRPLPISSSTAIIQPVSLDKRGNGAFFSYAYPHFWSKKMDGTRILLQEGNRGPVFSIDTSLRMNTTIAEIAKASLQSRTPLALQIGYVGGHLAIRQVHYTVTSLRAEAFVDAVRSGSATGVQYLYLDADKSAGVQTVMKLFQSFLARVSYSE